MTQSWGTLTTEQRREKLVQLEVACKAEESEHGIELKPRILSAGGVYGRELFIPAGVTLVGEIHLKPQINILLSGKIMIANENSVEVLEAPMSFVSPAGIKRAGYAIEDTKWITFLATELTEDKDIYPEFIAPSYEVLDKQIRRT